LRARLRLEEDTNKCNEFDEKIKKVVAKIDRKI
jgi:hypothetical protein